MATSDVALCNLALDRLGADPITALTDGTDRARRCARAYPADRDRLLDEIRPNFAIQELGLAQLPVAPLYGYAYQYQLPATVLRVLDVADEDLYPWKRQQDKLLTDANAVNCRCVVQIEDPTKFSPLFTEALICQLAADLAFQLTKSNAFAQQKKLEAQAAIAQAQAAEGAEGSTVVYQSSTLYDARQ